MELWRDIEGFNGRYQISSWGRVRNANTGCILKPYKNERGYLKVYLNKGKGKYVKPRINRLVAQAFIPNPENKPQVDHIDSNPFNNNVENLRWVNIEEQFSNEESKKKRELARERTLKVLKLKPLIKSLLEIVPDKLQLVKMIIDYNA